MVFTPGALGSTSYFSQLEPGLVLKYPRPSDVFAAEIQKSFLIERQIFENLGKHCRIVRYHGWRDQEPGGLILDEASHGNLQEYLDNNLEIPSALREKWCRQAVESIAYIHRKGVVHSDLRPENFLVHGATTMSLDLWLCDFGGSTCERLGLHGNNLPDSGFYDPNTIAKATQATDMFSLGSVLYTIVTGHWPYRAASRPRTPEDIEAYEAMVDGLFARKEYPDVKGILNGDVILKCWRHEYSDVGSIEQDMK